MTSASSPALEFYIHLQDGRIVRFAQSDPEIANALLDRIEPTEFFSRQHFAIGGDQSMTAFRSSAVVRIDFVTEHMPEWRYPDGIQSVQELTEGEYRERYRPELHGGRAVIGAEPEGAETVFAELEMVNGERVFLEVHVGRTEAAAPVPLNQADFIEQLFTSGGMHAGRRGSGVILLNPATIVRLSFYPGAAQPDAWPAHRLRD
jgi:hypothetical protein